MAGGENRTVDRRPIEDLIVEILKENSPLKTSQIRLLLKTNYQKDHDRKTIQRHTDSLIKIGLVEPRLTTDKQIGYSLKPKRKNKKPKKDQKLQQDTLHEQSRFAHERRIVEEVRKAWEEQLSHPHKILNIQPFGESVRIDFSPFQTNPHVKYFEEHLKTGYPSLWKKIKAWRDAYSQLVSTTQALMEKTIQYMRDSSPLPEYNRLEHTAESIHYNQFILAYFNTLWSELEGQRNFEVKQTTTSRGEVKWYGLDLRPGYTFVDSPNHEKILEIERKIRQFHSDKRVFEEFNKIFQKGEWLNAQTRGILDELEKIWAEVDNNVLLSGRCEAGIKGSFERRT